MEPSTLLVILVISAIICGTIAIICAHPSRQGLAFVLGVLFGPLGILIAAILRPLVAAPPSTAPGSSTSRPTGPAPACPELPDEFHIRRGPHHYGPYPLDTVLTYLADGTLLPTDQYRTPAGHWSLLSRTGLI